MFAADPNCMPPTVPDEISCQFSIGEREDDLVIDLVLGVQRPRQHNIGLAVGAQWVGIEFWLHEID